METYSPVQRKALSQFGTTVAAAWFTAGVISPFFTRPRRIEEALLFVIVGFLMTWATLRWSLSILEGVKI